MSDTQLRAVPVGAGVASVVGRGEITGTVDAGVAVAAGAGAADARDAPSDELGTALGVAPPQPATTASRTTELTIPRLIRRRILRIRSNYAKTMSPIILRFITVAANPGGFPLSSVRRSAAFAGAILLLVALAAPAAAHTPATLVIEELRMPATHSSSAVRGSGNGDGTSAACSDSAHRSEGGRQPGTYRWSFKSSTTPNGLSKSAVTAVLQKSFSNITGANNDCGRADFNNATHQYLGTTSRSPSCNSQDGQNVVAFGHLNFGILAVTCYWVRGGKITEADMKITTAESWALSMASCHGAMPLLESTITHEAGHVFGLDHVGENKHGRLTMSPYIDGNCEANEATLGLGDMLGLEEMY